MLKNTNRTCLTIFITSIFLSINVTASPQTSESLIPWQDWSQETFDQAQKKNKLVLLNLEAVWCHWCHVMEQQTYSNSSVAAIIEKHFIPVKVDHDARPDLAQRYRDYGWPATIILASDGTEIVKRSGYMKPENFARLLNTIVKDPTPEKAAHHFEPTAPSKSPLLSNTLEKKLLQRRLDTYDKKLGGYKHAVKYLDEAYLEYAITQASLGNKDEQAIAKKTLNSALALIDPVWGGAYQYSTYGDWQHPHFEKIMSTQARAIKLYAGAYSLWQDPKHLSAAKKIAQYLIAFLLDQNGAFYTSQDADLTQGVKGHDFFALDNQARRIKGMPRIDKHQYTQENGWAIEAFASLYEASGDTLYLEHAQQATHWILKNRRINNTNANANGFSHDQQTKNKTTQDHYFLGDNLAMSKAFLQLFRADADRQWLSYAISTTDFIEHAFRKKDAGYHTATSTLSPVPPSVHTDENIALARLCNLLFHYTGHSRYKKMAEHAMRWLVTPSIALQRIEESGILLAAYELANDPIHLTVIGHKESKQAQQLFNTALRAPYQFKRIEWWDTREGPLPNPDIQYPVLPKAAAFVCTNGRCSLPSFDSVNYQKNITRLTQ